MSDIVIITVALPEERLPEEDKKTLKTGETYKYGCELGQLIIGTLLDEGLIQAGHIEDTTYTTQYKWDGRTVRRSEREMRLKVGADKFNKCKDEIYQRLNGMHPYETISATSTEQHAMSDDLSRWSEGAMPYPPAAE